MKNFIIRVIMLSILILPSAVFAKADLSKFFVIGDSIAAGYQNGTITPASQQNSFPVLIAQQAGVNFVVPSLLVPPGPIPNNLVVPGERGDNSKDGSVNQSFSMCFTYTSCCSI